MEPRGADEPAGLPHTFRPRPRPLPRTAAPPRRARPSGRQSRVAGLVRGVGRPLPSGDGATCVRAAEAVRPLLGDRVHRLVPRVGPAGSARRQPRRAR